MTVMSMDKADRLDIFVFNFSFVDACLLLFQ